MYDILIIGAGITGSLIARKLSLYSLKVAVVEKGNDVAEGASMANSAILHTGYDPEEGTLKAKLNVEGAKLFPQLLKDLDCTYKQVGAYVVSSEENKEKLDVLASRAAERGIPHSWLSGEDLHRSEPHLASKIQYALCFPTTCIVYPWEIVTAAMEVAIQNGTRLFLNHEVIGIQKTEKGYRVETTRGSFETEMILNCSGTHTEQLARMVSERVSYHVHPRKGEYFVLDKGTDFVHHILFPVPTEKGKGVLVVPTVYGNILLGPSSESVEDRDDVSTSSSGLHYVREQLSSLVEDVPYSKIIRSFTGLRSSTDSRDFIVCEYPDAERFVDVASIESPGLASSPALCEYVIHTFVENYFVLTEKPEAVHTRKAPVVMQKLSLKERNAWIQKNPLYGKIVCRCEGISEQEIVDAIHSPIPCTSIKAIKKRVRPGMGKCQGGFCQPRIAAILARELHIPETEVVYDEEGSYLLDKENHV